MDFLLFGPYMSPVALIVILVIALLIFGKRLPEVARSLGKGIVEFKKGVKGIEDEVEKPLPPPAQGYSQPYGQQAYNPYGQQQPYPGQQAYAAGQQGYAGQQGSPGQQGYAGQQAPYQSPYASPGTQGAYPPPSYPTSPGPEGAYPQGSYGQAPPAAQVPGTAPASQDPPAPPPARPAD